MALRVAALRALVEQRFCDMDVHARLGALCIEDLHRPRAREALGFAPQARLFLLNSHPGHSAIWGGSSAAAIAASTADALIGVDFHSIKPLHGAYASAQADMEVDARFERLSVQVNRDTVVALQRWADELSAAQAAIGGASVSADDAGDAVAASAAMVEATPSGALPLVDLQHPLLSTMKVHASLGTIELVLNVEDDTRSNSVYAPMPFARAVIAGLDVTMTQRVASMRIKATVATVELHDLTPMGRVRHRDGVHFIWFRSICSVCSFPLSAFLNFMRMFFYQNYPVVIGSGTPGDAYHATTMEAQLLSAFAVPGAGAGKAPLIDIDVSMFSTAKNTPAYERYECDMAIHTARIEGLRFVYCNRFVEELQLYPAGPLKIYADEKAARNGDVDAATVAAATEATHGDAAVDDAVAVAAKEDDAAQSIGVPKLRMMINAMLIDPCIVVPLHSRSEQYLCLTIDEMSARSGDANRYAPQGLQQLFPAMLTNLEAGDVADPVREARALSSPSPPRATSGGGGGGGGSTSSSSAGNPQSPVTGDQSGGSGAAKKEDAGEFGVFEIDDDDDNASIGSFGTMASDDFVDASSNESEGEDDEDDVGDGRGSPGMRRDDNTVGSLGGDGFESCDDVYDDAYDDAYDNVLRDDGGGDGGLYAKYALTSGGSAESTPTAKAKPPRARRPRLPVLASYAASHPSLTTVRVVLRKIHVFTSSKSNEVGAALRERSVLGATLNASIEMPEVGAMEILLDTKYSPRGGEVASGMMANGLNL